jgi:hypothetical protein
MSYEHGQATASEARKLRDAHASSTTNGDEVSCEPTSTSGSRQADAAPFTSRRVLVKR